MLLVGRRKEPKEELITLAGLGANREITSVRFAHIKVDLRKSGAVDIEIYAGCSSAFISKFCGNVVKPKESGYTYLSWQSCKIAA